MKKPSFISKLNNRQFLIIWLIFHLGFALYFASVYFATKGDISIDADLFNMFPKSFNEESIRIVDEKLTTSTAQNVFILSCNSDFENAKKAAENVYNKLLKSEKFKSVNLYSENTDFSEVLSLLKKYRYNLLDDDSIEQIEESPQMFAQEALESAYSPFSLLPLNLEEDPFMLEEKIANYYINVAASSGISMSAKEGVLASSYNGNWYVMIQGILSKEGAALSSQNNGVSEIYNVCNSVENYGSRFIFSGTPVNSHQSSNSAMKEISLISTVSIFVVILILILIFRSPLPILCSLASIFMSIGIAFAATLAIFHQIHILTLVFGTSLIGSCIDYSLHYFTHWAGNKELLSGSQIRKHLMGGLSMAIVSTVLCYIILMFAPFDLLRQMSVFSITGLLSSFLTTICIYPMIPIPKKNRELKMLKFVKPSKNKNRKKMIGRIGITAMFVFSIGTILILHSRVSVHNDLFKLYTMKGKILEDRNETVNVIKYNPSCWFIVCGNDENETLAREENLRKKLESYSDEKISYASPSKFIPSESHQKKSREAVKKLLEISVEQYESLGFEASYAENLKKDFETTEGDYISFERENVPSFLASKISKVWLGKIGEKYYSVIMPNMVSNPNGLKQFESTEDGVYFISKMADMARDLDKLTTIVIEFFALAYIVMFIILKFFYSWKQSLKIISIPILIIFMSAAIFAISKIDLEFFSVTGLILVFGLGVDYIIYMVQNENDKALKEKTIEPFATFLSFFTTAISFGALALSSFQPVHLMGLSIFVGLTTAYVSTIFYDRSL